MSIRRTMFDVRGALLHWPQAVSDSIQNRRCVNAQQRILILHHSANIPHFHNCLLDWLEAEIPSVRALFELHLLPFFGVDLSDYIVCAPWLQDPAEDWLPHRSWRRLQEIEQLCAKHDIPVINPSKKLSNATKSTGARIMSSLGARVPSVLPIANPEKFQRDSHGLRFPLIIREDRRHTAPTCFVKSAAQLRSVPWHRFSCPVAAEFIDVRSPNDGLYRKYRYVAARDIGVPRHLIISRYWEVRASQRELNRRTKEEEIAYLNQADVNHDTLQRLREALQLDVVAFDYSYAADGQLVVWEANPYPNLSTPTGTGTEYTAPYVARSYAAIAAMYLTAGQLELHPRLVELLGVCLDTTRTEAPPTTSSRNAASQPPVRRGGGVLSELLR
jgi:hypothetical protein